MLFQRIESEGLAHYSYLVGSAGQAIIIDPRRDCDVYVDTTLRAGYRITHILETHRNEDYVVGSMELAARTGAQVWHADSQWDYQYGQPVQDGQTWRLGGLSLKAMHTPGHTPGSMSYLLYDSGSAPLLLFGGDVLFADDVGRTDLLGQERLAQMTGLLYETIFHKLLPLGDHIILCPAHGAGSVCGAAIGDRPWTTLGFERQHNPRLRYTTRVDFLANVGKMLELPPYFAHMEQLNLEGVPLLGPLPAPIPLRARDFAGRLEQSVVVDTRMELGFASAHVPGSTSIWLDGLASFAGWFLPYDKPLLLVDETENPEEATRRLIRMGYDQLTGYLAGGMLAWHKAGLESRSVAAVTVQQVCRRIDSSEEMWILDVRSDAELEHVRIPGARHIHITQLPQHLDEVPRDRDVYVFCGSGLRSMIAASLLQRAGYERLAVVLGGIGGWISIRCPLERRS